MLQRGRKSLAALVAVSPQPTPPPGYADATPAPPHLSPAAAELWRAVAEAYVLEAHHARLLALACTAFDRAEQARAALADHGGLTTTDAHGRLLAHPAVAIERNAAILHSRLLRELDLDGDLPFDRRPPSLPSNRG